jgi:hypothetical protein
MAGSRTGTEQNRVEVFGESTFSQIIYWDFERPSKATYYLERACLLTNGLTMLSRFVKGVRIHSQYRNLWTQRTVSNTDLTKCVSQSLTGLPNKPIDVCVALVSRSFSANDILKLNTEFLKHINPKIFIGAVVDRVPSPDSGGHGLSVLIGQEEDATGFIVEDTADRKKIKSVSVGRWGRVQDFNRFEFEENDIDKFGWEGFKSVSRNVHDHSLIPQLQNL